MRCCRSCSASATAISSASSDKLGVALVSRGNRLDISGTGRPRRHRARRRCNRSIERLERGQEIDTAAVDAALRHGQTRIGAARRWRKTPTRSAPASAASRRAARIRRDYITALRSARSGVRPRPRRHRQDLSRRRHGGRHADERRRSSASCCRGPRSRRASGWAFCPAICSEKVDPYLRPLYDALYDMLPGDQVMKRIDSGEIEIAPLAFMRGRTLANAYRHSRRGAEHHAGADEDVPDPARRERAHGGDRRSDADRSAARRAARA